MHLSLMVYVRFISVILVSVTCFLGDYVVLSTKHPILRALADNGTHALVGALSGIVFLLPFHDKISNVVGWLMIVGCFVSSSLIDLDHFIEAKTFSLEIATSITHRPFLHCSTIPLIILMTYVAVSCMNYFKTSLALGIVCCAFFTHHCRDAVRRGFWFCPFGHTTKLPYLAYILITILTPYIMVYLYTICRSNFAQNILGFGGKPSYDMVPPSSRSNTRYSIV